MSGGAGAAATVSVSGQHLKLEPMLKGSELRVSVVPMEMVQYIAEKGLKEVPAAFIQPLERRPTSQTLAKKIPSTIQIPVIDMANYNLNEEGGMDQQALVDEVGRACEEWGFFQVINHGIPESIMQAAMDMCHEFFALPIEEKEQYCMKTSSGIGYGRRFAVKEGVRVDWVDQLGLWSATEKHRTQDPLNVKRPEAFNENMYKYGDEILKLSHTILTMLSQHAGLPPNYLLERLQQGKSSSSVGVRTGMNYYPPCPQPNLVMGLSSHADGSVLTLVQQDRVSGREARGANSGVATPGLEVLMKDGTTWVPVPPIPNAFVVNIGDQIQMISNDKYKSVVHRALASRSGRMSIANFFLPEWETAIHPAPRFFCESNPPRYRAVKYSEYITNFMKVPLGGKRFIDNYKVPTNHPI